MGDVSCDILWGAWSRPFLALQPIKPKPAVLHVVPPGRNSWDGGRFRGGDRCLRAFFDSILRVVFVFVLSMSCGFPLLFLLLFNIFSFFYASFSVALRGIALFVCWGFLPKEKHLIFKFNYWHIKVSSRLRSTSKTKRHSPWKYKGQEE